MRSRQFLLILWMASDSWAQLQNRKCWLVNVTDLPSMSSPGKGAFKLSAPPFTMFEVPGLVIEDYAFKTRFTCEAPENMLIVYLKVGPVNTINHTRCRLAMDSFVRCRSDPVDSGLYPMHRVLKFANCSNFSGNIPTQWLNHSSLVLQLHFWGLANLENVSGSYRCEAMKVTVQKAGKRPAVVLSNCEPFSGYMSKVIHASKPSGKLSRATDDCPTGWWGVGCSRKCFACEGNGCDTFTRKCRGGSSQPATQRSENISVTPTPVKPPLLTDGEPPTSPKNGGAPPLHTDEESPARNRRENVSSSPSPKRQNMAASQASPNMTWLSLAVFYALVSRCS